MPYPEDGTVASVRGLGTLVNVATVVLGTLLGVVVGARIPPRARGAVLSVVGLTTVVIGIDQALETRNVVFPLVALILGTIVGELLRIEDRLATLGERVRGRVEARGDRDDPGDRNEPPTRFVEGFVAASVLFCVGPLTVLGSIQDGLGGPDHAELLLVKSALDGVVAIVFASTMGWGVGFSVIPIVAVQGTLTLLAGQADDVLTTRMVAEMTAAGGVMILGIGLRLLEIRQVPVASFLPALVLAPVLVALFAR